MSDYRFTFISLLFLVSAGVSFFVAYIAWQKRRVRGAAELSRLMLSAGYWAFCIIFETASPTIEAKILWSKISYLGALSTPLLYAFFIFRFVGKDNFLTKTRYVLFSIFPSVVLFLAWTNEHHNLVWTGFAPIDPDTNLTQYFHGIAFWIGYAGYIYVLFAVATFYLLRFTAGHMFAFKLQTSAIFAASLCPWIASLFYLTGFNIVPGFDLVPLSIMLSGLFFASAIIGMRFLDLVPVARERLLESIREGIIVLDQFNRIQDINRSARIHTGIGNGELSGMYLDKMSHIDAKIRNALLEDSPKVTIETYGEEGVKYYSIEKQYIDNYPGSRLVILKDETSDVAREKEMIVTASRALESDRLKSSFLANLSHEIRTPLNVITGFLDVLKSDDLQSEEREVYMDLLKENSERILGTLNDIIEISKIEAGQVKMEKSQINLNEIIDYLEKLYEKPAKDKGLVLYCSKALTSRESLIYTDRIKLVSVYSNLLKNSIKYTNSGSVAFGYEYSMGSLTFFVEDTGIGIEPQQQEMVFNRFVQAEHSINRPYEGAGLGLSIVKAYASMLGGSIELWSKPGSGSRFWFSVPYEPVLPENLG